MKKKVVVNKYKQILISFTLLTLIIILLNVNPPVTGKAYYYGGSSYGGSSDGGSSSGGSDSSEECIPIDESDFDNSFCNETSNDGKQCGSYPGSICSDGYCKEVICYDGLDNDASLDFVCGDCECEDGEEDFCSSDCPTESEGSSGGSTGSSYYAIITTPSTLSVAEMFNSLSEWVESAFMIKDESLIESELILGMTDEELREIIEHQGGWTDPSPIDELTHEELINFIEDNEDLKEIILETGSPGPFLPTIEETVDVTKSVELSTSERYISELLETRGDLKNTELVTTFMSSDNIAANNRVQSQFYQSMLNIGLSEEMAQEYSAYYSQFDTQNIYAAAIRTNLVGFASGSEESDGIDCLDSDCDLQPCDDGSVCINYECVKAEYNAPAPIVFEIEPAYQIQTYYDFLMYLNEGESLNAEEITNNYNGICDDYCKSIGGICGFANSGLNECSSEGSENCVCYNEQE